MGHLGVVLYEYLGEEYPEVLGSILGALKVSSAIPLIASTCVQSRLRASLSGLVSFGAFVTMPTVFPTASLASQTPNPPSPRATLMES